MRYSYEYKSKCIELYKQGILPEIPEGITEEGFRGMLRRWIRQDTANGYEGLRHRVYNRKESGRKAGALYKKSYPETAMSR